jgi:RimJ/RimL family protein N-acetyltransferase
VSAAAIATGTPAAPRRYPRSLIDRLRLDDGREVIVRPVLAKDAAAAQDFVRALSPASRLRRFHFGLRELPLSMLQAMTRVDHDRHVAVIAEALDDDESCEPPIVADARYVRDDDGTSAEFAIAVADDWQGEGLGRMLLQRLARHAARHGITHLVGDVLPGNAAMFAIGERLGGTRVTSAQGAGVVRVRIPVAAMPACYQA